MSIVSQPARLEVAVVGAGWAGLAAAITLCANGHQVTVFEASRQLGGRARALPLKPHGVTQPNVLDNGQHILIGAYTECLALMRQVGVDPESVLHRLPLALQFPDGTGLRLPDWPAPLDALWGICAARGWAWRDKLSLLRTALGWQLQGFECEPELSVYGLCTTVTATVMRELIEPLCVSALNTPASRASGSVFLRVLKDSLFSPPGSSNLLLPKTDLSSLFPHAAGRWITQRGAVIRYGERVKTVAPVVSGWRVAEQNYDRVVLAIDADNAAAVLINSAPDAPLSIATQMRLWATQAQSLRHEAITTVYAMASGARLPLPMMALRSEECVFRPSTEIAQPAYCGPAQFVFDRGQLDGPAGLLAFVVSASLGSVAQLQAAVMVQAQAQLGLTLKIVKTVVEKRATFCCTPGLVRPEPDIAPGLIACGDYVQGPYPATLEGAVRSGNTAAKWAAAKPGLV